MLKHGSLKLVVTILMVLIVDILSAPPLLSANPNGYVSHEFIPSPNYTQNDARALLQINGDAWGLPQTDVVWKDPQGLTASCRPIQGGCRIFNQYSSTGVLIGRTHEFLISGQQRPSGTYTAIVTNCYGCAELFRDHFYISDASTTYTISGNAGTAGATLSYVDGVARTVTADGTGNYTLTVPSGWSGTVTPSRTDYTFSPVSRSYTNLSAAQTAHDYTAMFQALTPTLTLTPDTMRYLYLPLLLKGVHLLPDPTDTPTTITIATHTPTSTPTSTPGIPTVTPTPGDVTDTPTATTGPTDTPTPTSSLPTVTPHTR